MGNSTSNSVMVVPSSPIMQTPPMKQDPFASYLQAVVEEPTSCSMKMVQLNPHRLLSFMVMHDKMAMAVLTITNPTNAHIVYRVASMQFPMRYDMHMQHGVVGPGRSTAIPIRLNAQTCQELHASGKLPSDEFVVDTVVLTTPPSTALVQQLETVDMWPHVPLRYRQPTQRVTAIFTTWTPNAHDI